MRVLFIRTQTQYYGFTAQHISELLRIDAHQLLDIAQRKAFILRNEFIPITPLFDLVHRTNTPFPQRDHLLLLIIRIRNEKLALLIDELIDESDVIIKPLPPHLQSFSLVSGIVVNGNNELISILHTPELLARARLSKVITAAPTSHATQPNTPQGQWHILVVDDSLNTREIEKDVLEAHGYRVSLAEDGQDGLQKAREGDFDAILTDVEMPNMDGFTLTTRLREEEKYRYRPIIIITSREKEEDKRRGIQVGADAYIVKGDFDQSNLIQTLNALLG
jgi:two-component system chemotaxis sensor kinase CheA